MTYVCTGARHCFPDTCPLKVGVLFIFSPVDQRCFQRLGKLGAQWESGTSLPFVFVLIFSTWTGDKDSLHGKGVWKCVGCLARYDNGSALQAVHGQEQCLLNVWQTVFCNGKLCHLKCQYKGRHYEETAGLGSPWRLVQSQGSVHLAFEVIWDREARYGPPFFVSVPSCHPFIYPFVCPSIHSSIRPPFQYSFGGGSHGHLCSPLFYFSDFCHIVCFSKLSFLSKLTHLVTTTSLMPIENREGRRLLVGKEKRAGRVKRIFSNLSWYEKEAPKLLIQEKVCG